MGHKSVSSKQNLLCKLGVIRWQLRRYDLFKNSVPLTFDRCIRLAIIADPLPVLSTPFIQDILRALSLHTYEVVCLPSEYIDSVPPHLLCWILGEILVPRENATVTSAPLDQLQHCGQAKKRLWEQFCIYEQYFSIRKK